MDFLMYVVTGGAGFIGSNILSALEKKKKQKLVICDRLRSESKWKNIAKRNLFDIVHPDKLFEFLNDNTGSIEAVIHMGAISSTTERDADKIIQNNFCLSRDLWNWTTGNKTQYIYASSAATYGGGESGFDDKISSSFLQTLRPLNPYGWSKLLFDRWIAKTLEDGGQTPPQWIGLKFFNVYGPNEYHKKEMRSVVAQIFPDAKAGRACKLFQSHHSDYQDGGQLRDFVYVQDCSNIVLWLIEKPSISGLFNCGSGQARSFSDLANIVYKSLNQKPKIEFIPTPIHIRDKYQYCTEAPMTKLRKAGYKAPSTSLEAGINDYITQFLQNDDPNI